MVSEEIFFINFFSKLLFFLGMNSRSGSSQASRENSTTRGSGGGEGGRSLTQAARSMGQMNNNNNFSSSSSATKSSASHNKFTSLQQNIPGTRGMPTKVQINFNWGCNRKKSIGFGVEL